MNLGILKMVMASSFCCEKRGNDIGKPKSKNLKKNRKSLTSGVRRFGKVVNGETWEPHSTVWAEGRITTSNLFPLCFFYLPLSRCHLSPLPVRIASISPLCLQVCFPPFPLFTVVPCGILKSSSFIAFLRNYGSGFVSSCSNFNGFMLGRMIWLGFLVFIWYFLRRFRKFVKGSFFFFLLQGS